MCYGGPDTIDWSYILPDDGRVVRTPTNKQGCCPWPWFLVVLNDKILVLGPGLGAQIIVKIPGCFNVVFVNYCDRSVVGSVTKQVFTVH